jgi:cobalt/nickel transport system permease protein
MSDIKNSINQITSLEELTKQNTPIHHLHPAIKLLVTIVYLVAVISLEADEISGLFPFFLYPVLLMVIGEIPFRPLVGRLMVALPFTFFAGLSNMLFSKETAMVLGGFAVTKGMMVFVSILIKTILTVIAVLILMSTTAMNDLLYAMLYFHMPSILVLQIMMTFRYLGVLLGEVSVMYHAYILRAPREKGIKLKDLGSFLGQLIIRSFDRAERIYHAMKCRGFEGRIAFSEHRSITLGGWLYVILMTGIILIFRLVNISVLIGNLVV